LHHNEIVNIRAEYLLVSSVSYLSQVYYNEYLHEFVIVNVNTIVTDNVCTSMNIKRLSIERYSFAIYNHKFGFLNRGTYNSVRS